MHIIVLTFLFQFCINYYEIRKTLNKIFIFNYLLPSYVDYNFKYSMKSIDEDSGCK